ncbi:hypothetical protein [Paractinoplanes rishiriensis]|uniref:Uncharacterized protein n=1 Tax=Paractinoplanes rishiriensis TaxID=1050105 RepID=A0A919MM62_9ACTN|nr:hypothetical protein [Actinoplanes rishiriensis]GIE92631.1 hypothetical protein Ari01nite_00960 [Actinoplanes rishiriensis]
MTTPAYPYRRLLVSVDMERYSRQDNEAQYQAQQIFQRVMQAACDELELDRSRWSTQSGGDGELAIIPPDVPESRVVGELTAALDRLLAAENRYRGDDRRIRLRVAVHEGLVHLDGAAGFPGDAVVTVCRLVNDPQLKAALRSFPRANIAMIVSDVIYRSVVVPYGKPRPDRFRQVRAQIPEKDFGADAWIFVPDEDATGGAPAGARHEAPPPGPAPGPAPTYSVDRVEGHNVALGNHNTFNR